MMNAEQLKKRCRKLQNAINHLDSVKDWLLESGADNEPGFSSIINLIEECRDQAAEAAEFLQDKISKEF